MLLQNGFESLMPLNGGRSLRNLLVALYFQGRLNATLYY